MGKFVDGRLPLIFSRVFTHTHSTSQFIPWFSFSVHCVALFPGQNCEKMQIEHVIDGRMDEQLWSGRVGQRPLALAPFNFIARAAEGGYMTG